MDNGGGPQGPGSIGAAWELGFERVADPQEARATRFFLGAERRARRQAARAPRTAEYVADPKARARARRCRATATADAWKAQPPYDWAPVAAGKGARLRHAAARAATS